MLENRFRTFSGGIMRVVKVLTIDASGVLHVNGDAVACESLMKYIGISDSDGQDIYVGDILQSQVDKNLFNWLVVDNGFCFGVKNIGLVHMDTVPSFQVNDYLFFIDRKIIGNAHQNPELLTSLL